MKSRNVRSGYISMNVSYWRNTGDRGVYWSRSGVASTTADTLDLTTSATYPSNGPFYRYNAFSLRCLQE